MKFPHLSLAFVALSLATVAIAPNPPGTHLEQATQYRRNQVWHQIIADLDRSSREEHSKAAGRRMAMLAEAPPKFRDAASHGEISRDHFDIAQWMIKMADMFRLYLDPPNAPSPSFPAAHLNPPEALLLSPEERKFVFSLRQQTYAHAALDFETRARELHRSADHGAAFARSAWEQDYIDASHSIDQRLKYVQHKKQAHRERMLAGIADELAQKYLRLSETYAAYHV